ncbi:GAF domain-containing protein [Leptolyngbya sp. FACHB-36]|uniref:sensor histidine kinase n=1 Tax=Leptolyngbya sp. FACHB-36 TaxID=2692808 RepID=UPI001681696A|nr:GAF domain-containing protein [Leptolyngbya sp. FACHB-36]MBD2021749.1 GAF domain-containing protein [Leptolyngbya sp. FACHB-36]
MCDPHDLDREQQYGPMNSAEQNQNWLNLLATVSPIGIFRANVDGSCRYVNDRWCEISGMSAEEAMGTGWAQAIHPDDRHQAVADWLEAIRTQSSFQSQYRFQHRDGTITWVLGQAIVERGPDGTVLGYIGTATDITQRKQAEEALRQQTERERLIAAITQHIRQSLNLKQVLNTTVEEVRQFLQTDRVLILRFEPDWSGTVLVESVGAEWVSLSGIEIDDSWLAESYAQHYQQGQACAVTDIHSPERSSCYPDALAGFQVQAALVVPILQGEHLWGLLIAHHCQAPRSWQSYETELLRQLAAQVSSAIQQSQLYQQVQRLNADLERQVQKHAAQLQLASEFEATLKRITDRVRDSLDEDQILQTAVQELALATGVSSCNSALYDQEQRTSTVRYEYTTSLVPFQGRVVQMDNFPEGYNQLIQGHYFQFCSLMPIPRRGPVAMLACPILDDQGVLGDLWLVSHAYHAFSDQDIRLVQQVANQCAIALRQARLYQEAQAQVKELEKLNRLKDDFLSTVSHELRTPMSNIKLATQMLELALKKPTDATESETASGASRRPSECIVRGELGTLMTPDVSAPSTANVDRYLKILKDECQREISLINDLLDLSRLEAGTEPLVLTEIALPTWISHFVTPFVERAQNQQQHLHIAVPTELPDLTTDALRLERVLGELLHNACKYTPSQGRITLSAAAESKRVRLQVSNTGAEISSKELIRVFDKFYRIPNNDPWKHGGTGLGLALVRRLVETLGGSVYASSDAGVTCFTVELPWLPQTAIAGIS